MLSVVLKILSILGILLLCLLGLVVLMILLVFFFPVCYRISGKKSPEEMVINARAWWLFGLLRVSFVYPEQGRLFIKVLPFTVYDSGKATGETQETADSGARTKKDKEQTEAAESGQTPEKDRERTEETESGQTPEKDREQTEAAENEQTPEKDREQTEAAESEKTAEKSPEQAETADGEDIDSSFFKKIEKIKYTIRSRYDKIKNIWENISYYIDLLREEETKLLFSHVIFRLGKVLKSIRPRRIKGQILFGTGSPDTTGYAYGVYGMLSPFLRNRLLVTPDFTRAVLEGDIYIAGHITVFAILWNGLKILLDRKFRRFIKKMKAGRKS